MTQPRPNDLLVTSLSEFTALKAEIGYRTTAQNSLVTFTALAVGGITSYALSRNAAAELVPFAIVPLITAAGLQWLDHAHAIYKTGDYIKHKLWAQLRKNINESLSCWEEYVLQDVDREEERNVVFLPFFFLFTGPGLVALIYLCIRSNNSWAAWVTWSIEVLTMMYLTNRWADFLSESLHIRKIDLPGRLLPIAVRQRRSRAPKRGSA